MPKAMLTFKLPEEQPEFSDALKGTTYKVILYEVAEMLKRAEESDPPKTAAVIREDFWKLMEDEKVDPYED